METVLPPGITETQAQDYARRRRDIAAASAVPLPGPLLNGVEPPPKKVLGFTLRPVVLSDIAFLQRIESPLIKVAEAAAKSNANGESLTDSAVKAFGLSSSDATIQSFFIMCSPVSKIRALMKEGVERFKDAAAEEVGDKLPAGGLAKIQEALVENFAAAFSTAVDYEIEQPEGGDGSFTQPQPRKATG